MSFWDSTSCWFFFGARFLILGFVFGRPFCFTTGGVSSGSATLAGVLSSSTVSSPFRFRFWDALPAFCPPGAVLGSFSFSLNFPSFSLKFLHGGSMAQVTLMNKAFQICRSITMPMENQHSAFYVMLSSSSRNGQQPHGLLADYRHLAECSNAILPLPQGDGMILHDIICAAW